MPRIHLTDRTVKSLKPGDKQEEYWDSALSGFVVRVSPGGKKSFNAVYRNARSEKCRISLGDCEHVSLAEARNRAREVMGEVARGKDPARAKREHREADTFAQLCGEYLRLHVEPNLRPASLYQANWIIERELKPRWGRTKARDVRRRDIIALLDEIAVDRGHPVYANRVRALVSSIFSFGLRREVVEASPCVGLPKKCPEKPRERILSDDEVREFWKATGEEDPVIRDLFRLLLLLGQRSGETKAMEWAQIRDGIWYIPATATKNGKEQVVPLPESVIQILSPHRINGCDGVFVARGSYPVRWIQKAKCRIAARMSRQDWTAHDLRRTCASGMERLGVSGTVIASVLNHSKSSRQGVTAVYTQHRHVEEKRQALGQWYQYVSLLVSPTALAYTNAGTSAS